MFMDYWHLNMMQIQQHARFKYMYLWIPFYKYRQFLFVQWDHWVMHLCKQSWEVLLWHLVYIYGFGGLIDGCSALGVVYNVSLGVVMTIRAGWAGGAGVAIWRARRFAAHLRAGFWSRQTYELYWEEISCIVKVDWVIYLYYTTGNLSDIDHNANNEAIGPFKWIYVIIRTDFCCIRVIIIIGLGKLNASPDKPDWEAKSHLTLWGISDIDHNANN